MLASGTDYSASRAARMRWPIAIHCACAGLNAAPLRCFDVMQRCMLCSPLNGCQLVLASAPQCNLCCQARFCVQSRDRTTQSNPCTEHTSAAPCAHTNVHQMLLCKRHVSAACAIGIAAPIPNILSGSDQGNSMSSAPVPPGQASQTPPCPSAPIACLSPQYANFFVQACVPWT